MLLARTETQERKLSDGGAYGGSDVCTPSGGSRRRAFVCATVFLYFPLQVRNISL